MSILPSNQYWILRQNYGSKTDQNDVRKLIMSQNFVSCPWGGWGVHRENVLLGVFNNPSTGESANDQDRKFVEEMQIGDILLIPFAGKKSCIVARITSDVEYKIDTGLFWTEINNKNKIGDEGEPFSPVGRRIEVINPDFVKPTHLPRRTLSQMKNPVIIASLKI